MTTVLVWTTIVFYVVGCVWGMVSMRRITPGGRRMPRVWLVAGFLTQTALLVLRWLEAGRFPVTQAGDSLWLLTWFMALVFLLLNVKYGLAALTPLMLLVVLVLVGLGLLPGPARQTELPAWTPVHVAAVVLGFAAFALAAITSLAYLLQERSLKRKSGELPGRLPALEKLDRINFYVLSVGWVLVTLGLGIGIYAALAGNELGPAWWSDSKVVVSLVTWGFYTGVVVCRWVRSLAGRPMAWLTLVGFVLVVLTLVGTDVLAPGVHALGR